MTTYTINPNGLFPDSYVLGGMPELGEDTDDTKVQVQVLQNNMIFCAFLLNFKESQPPPGIPRQLFVRIQKYEKNESPLATAAITNLARTVLPSLVPKVWGSGYSWMKDGTKVSYVLSQWYPDSCPLETVWDDLGVENRGEIVGDLFEAVSKLCSLSLQKLTFEQWQLLRNTPFETKKTELSILVGGPPYGYHTDFASLMRRNLCPRNADCAVNGRTDGTLVVSVHAPEAEHFGFAETDLDLLTQSSVLCHNDLEPHNLLVKKVYTERGDEYRLVAILNWDQAGFVPFAFEVARKDLHLGLRNFNWSWYDMYRQLAGHQLFDTPGRPIWSKLIRCLMAVHSSSQAKITEISTSDGTAQMLWLENEGLTFSTLVEEGWVKLRSFVEFPSDDEQDIWDP
ncbi:hypothetical protein CABS01_13185 [Colletotrichum abscissum]|uniref:Aminoglycoside phosphotransferase domain-containing protein n=1 Tax=Colletotrichum abscissum TaxID=1671311 RepID=A0A9P9XHW3_9PEZI|nr:uncharacterized protein CABS01_13185 [Colletotrichum abscissum]KAI3530381.1 hypothetical protein CSPX01_14872 [Colletotrichum filicis]KAI3554099.1 hypothetical protein CABS02_05819 [Colletotrichum abscissum]KAK1486557.1 hypothetical protein CABS01_13185 [Colletotrichum abscissum]